MFSEVFKPHTKNEADEICIAGTAKTTPAICDIRRMGEAMALFSSIHRFHSNIYWIMGHGSDF